MGEQSKINQNDVREWSDKCKKASVQLWENASNYSIDESETRIIESYEDSLGGNGSARIIEDSLTLFFPLHDHFTFLKTFDPRNCTLYAYGWKTNFGDALSFQVVAQDKFSNSEPKSWVILTNLNILNVFTNLNELKLIFHLGYQFHSGFHIKKNGMNLLNEIISVEINKLQVRTSILFEDKELSTLQIVKSFAPNHKITTKLEFQLAWEWLGRYFNFLSNGIRFWENFRDVVQRIDSYDIEHFSSSQVKVWEKIIDYESFYNAVGYIIEELRNGKEWIVFFPPISKSNNLGFHVYEWLSFVASITLDPRVTNYGQSLPMHDINTIKSISINIRNPNSLKIWKKYPAWFLVPHKLVSSEDIHITLSKAQIDKLAKCKKSEIKHSNDVSKEYLTAVHSFKKWSIPNNAVVKVDTGLFTHFVFLEIEHLVTVKALTKSGEYCLFEVNVKDQELISSLQEQLSVQEFEELDCVNAAYFLLISAMIHDFTVPEYRESSFTSEYPKRSSLPKSLKDTGIRVVYIPKIIYNNKRSIKSVADEIKKDGGVAKHSVRAHLRSISGKCSKFQQLLAKKYGFNEIDEGQTFVRPFTKGGKEKEIIYRSRSATKLVFRENNQFAHSSNEVEWFKFEKDVGSLLKSMGFEIDHNAASRNGDDGVDLIARKGKDLDEIQWLVQCKCWSTRRTVGISTVREMVGSLEETDRGTRGMIVTTSNFSPDALNLASKHNIKLLNGEEFTELTASLEKNDPQIQESPKP